jgi:hypothetical protein
MLHFHTKGTASSKVLRFGGSYAWFSLMDAKPQTLFILSSLCLVKESSVFNNMLLQLYILKEESKKKYLTGIWKEVDFST